MVFCYLSPLMSLVGGSGRSTFIRTVQFQFITVFWWTLTERQTNISFLMEHSNIGQANLFFFSPSTELKGQKLGINSPQHQPVHPAIIRQITWKYSLCRHRSSFNELFSHLSISHNTCRCAGNITETKVQVSMNSSWLNYLSICFVVRPRSHQIHEGNQDIPFSSSS